MEKQKIIMCLNNLLILFVTFFIIFSPFSKKIVKISFFVAIFCWLLINIIRLMSSFYKQLIVKSPVNKQMLLFCLVIILSTIFSVDPYYSDDILLERFLGYFLFFCLGSYSVKDNNNVFIIIMAAFGGASLLGIGGIYDLIHYGEGRLFTSFRYLVSLARFFVIYIPLSFIILCFCRNRVLKTGGLISFALLIPCLIVNEARAAWVAVVISMLIVSFFKNRKIAYYLLIGFIISLLFSSPQLLHRVSTTFDPMTWGERVPLWNIALAMFSDFPLFGVGLGMNEKLFSQYWEPSALFSQFRYWDVHNNYLEIASEAGIIGLISLVWIFIVFFKHVYVVLKKMSGDQQVILMALTSSVIAVLIFALSGSNITSGIQEATVFWFIFGMASGLVGLEKNQEKIA